MHDCEDPITGSIYSLEELRRLLRGSRVELDAVLQACKQLPYSFSCLLEEAGSIAAAVACDERRPFRS